jgi:hypothetical protein
MSVREAANIIVNHELDSVRNDLSLYAELSDDEELQKNLAMSLLRHALVIKSYRPVISAVKGERLESLCLLTMEDNREILNKSENPELARIAIEYLSNIQGDVRARVSEIQKALRGKGCYLSPEMNVTKM